jgi:hypothetical protein
MPAVSQMPQHVSLSVLARRALERYLAESTQ